MSFNPCPRMRKNVATDASTRPLTISTVGADPTCVTSLPVGQPAKRRAAAKRHHVDADDPTAQFSGQAE